MTEAHLQRILREADGGNILEALGEKLSPTDLQSLLLEAFRMRAEGLTPARVLDRYKTDRFVRMAAADPRDTVDFDALAYSIVSPRFQPVELSPVCPLGAASALATVSQNKIISTARNTEVVSDSTNVMALECAVRRATAETIRLCCSHRLMRAQGISGPISFAHFRVFTMCSAGRDTGSFEFEMSSLTEHITSNLRLLAALQQGGFGFTSPRVFLTDLRGDLAAKLTESVAGPVHASFPDVEIAFDPDRKTARNYYESVSLDIRVSTPDGEELSIGDGGFVDWTQKLLSNRKERLLISALGSERLCFLFGKHAAGSASPAQ